MAEQIGALPTEVVLFLQRVEQLVIESEGNTLTRTVRREGDRVIVSADQDDLPANEWRPFSETGEVPDEHLDRQHRATPAFELRIAVPADDRTPGVLFHYFPTKVRFPFPVVAHATMELTSNRQNLVDSKTNRYLAAKLAELLARVAEELPAEGDPWRRLKLMAKRSDLDPVLSELGFDEALMASARTKKLVPRRDGRLVEVMRLKSLRVDPSDWLAEQGFEDLALWTDDHVITRLLKEMGSEPLSAEEVRERLDGISPTLTMPQRAALIAGLVGHHRQLFVPKSPPPSLLVDDAGQLIGPGLTAYFPSTTRMSFAPPPWMPLRFISAELVEALLARVEKPREWLETELRDLGYKQVRSYDFAGLASAIVARMNERCEEEGADEETVRLEGIRALKELFGSTSAENRPQRRPQLRVFLPTRNADWQHADDLYLGDPYPSGRLMEALLGTLHPEEFVAEPSAFCLGADPGAWEEFVLWLGVEKLPRLKKRSHSLRGAEERGFAQHVRGSLRYPAQFAEFTAETPQDLDITSFTATTIEHVDEILERAAPHAVLAWVATDPRIDEWSARGDPSATLNACFRVRT